MGLILTRKINQSINIGKNVILTVLGTKGKQAKLGIQAPKIVKVDREEIYKKKKERGNYEFQNEKN